MLTPRGPIICPGLSITTSRKNNAQTPMRTAASFYKTMTIDEICKLPVADIAANNCALFLWVTNPTLNESFKVIDSWGFRFQNCSILLDQEV